MTYDQLVHRLLPEVEYHQNRYARELNTELSAGGRWLDLGAGSRLHGGWLGPTQQQLRERAGLVIGCDVSQDGLKVNPFLSGAVLANGDRLPFPDESFDLVTANMVLEHLSDPQGVFSEVARILGPGGRFVFLTPNLGHPVVWLLSWLLAPGGRRRLAVQLERRKPSHVFPTFYRANSSEAIRRAAAAAGLEVVHVEFFSSFPMVRHPLFLTRLECWWIRVTARPILARLRSNLVGCLRRAPEP